MMYSEQKHKRENRKDIGHFSKVGEGQSGQQLIKLHAVFSDMLCDSITTVTFNNSHSIYRVPLYEQIICYTY